MSINIRQNGPRFPKPKFLDSAKKTVKRIPRYVYSYSFDRVLSFTDLKITALPPFCTQKRSRKHSTDSALPDVDTVCDVVGSPFPKLALAAKGQTVFGNNLTSDE